MAPIIKEAWEIDLMRQAGRIVARGLKLLAEHARPGVTTAELDAIYEKHVRDSGAVPTFKGYRGFPASICASINDEVVHGIPSPRRVLKEGDIVSLDAGATYKGYVGDAAVTVGVGKISPAAQRLIETLAGSQPPGALFPAFALPARTDILNSDRFAGHPIYRVMSAAMQAGRSFPPSRVWGMIENRLFDALSAIWQEVLTDPKTDIRPLLASRIGGLAQRINLALAS